MLAERVKPWLIYLLLVLAPIAVRQSLGTLILSVLLALVLPKILEIIYLKYSEKSNGVLKGVHGLWGCRLEIYRVEYSPPQYKLKLNIPRGGKLYLSKTTKEEVYIFYEQHFLIKDTGYSPIRALEVLGFKLKPLTPKSVPTVCCRRVRPLGFAGPSILVLDGKYRVEEDRYRLGMVRKIKAGYFVVGDGKEIPIVRLWTGEHISESEAWDIAKQILYMPRVLSRDGVRIGSVKDVDVGFPVKLHILILGASGKGKSTLIASLLSKILNIYDYRVLVLDWYGEYSKLPGAIVLLPGRDIRVNPFERGFISGWDVIEQVLYYESGEKPFSYIQFEIALQAYERLSMEQKPLTASNLMEALYELKLDREDLLNARAALRRRLLRLVGEEFSETKLPPDDRGLYVADLSYFASDFEKMVFSWMILQNLLYNPPEKDTVIVMDEAQRYAPRFVRAETFLDRIMREGRKLGIKVVAATQTASDLRNTVINNADVIVVFRCTGEDAEIAANSLSPSHAYRLKGEIETLEVGECLLSISGRIMKIRVEPEYLPYPRINAPARKDAEMLKFLKQVDKIEEAVEKALEELYKIRDLGERRKLRYILEDIDLIRNLVKFKRGDRANIELLKKHGLIKRIEEGYKTTHLGETVLRILEKYIA